jgi:hypothetical protein
MLDPMTSTDSCTRIASGDGDNLGMIGDDMQDTSTLVAVPCESKRRPSAKPHFQYLKARIVIMLVQITR